MWKLMIDNAASLRHYMLTQLQCHNVFSPGHEHAQEPQEINTVRENDLLNRHLRRVNFRDQRRFLQWCTFEDKQKSRTPYTWRDIPLPRRKQLLNSK